MFEMSLDIFICEEINFVDWYFFTRILVRMWELTERLIMM